jgi:hypothetical protein
VIRADATVSRLSPNKHQTQCRMLECTGLSYNPGSAPAVAEWLTTHNISSLGPNQLPPCAADVAAIHTRCTKDSLDCTYWFVIMYTCFFSSASQSCSRFEEPVLSVPVVLDIGSTGCHDLTQQCPQAGMARVQCAATPAWAVRHQHGPPPTLFGDDHPGATITSSLVAAGLMGWPGFPGTAAGLREPAACPLQAQLG